MKVNLAFGFSIGRALTAGRNRLEKPVLTRCCASTQQVAHGSTQTNILGHSRIVARTVWQQAIPAGGLCLDATCGRGSDTIQLARLAGPGGRVVAFDIQEPAVEETRARVRQVRQAEGQLAVVDVHCKSHTDFSDIHGLEQDAVSAVVYNLGFYPSDGADQSVITLPETTVQSLEAAVPLVKLGGVITVMAYIAHAGGLEEAEAVLRWAGSLDSKHWTTSHLSHPNRPSAPTFLVAQRVS